RRHGLPRHRPRLPRRPGPSRLQPHADAGRAGPPRPLGPTGGSPLDSTPNPQPEQPTAGVTPNPPPGAKPQAAEEVEAARVPDEVPLTPAGWLMQNGIWLGLLVVGLVLLYRAYGWEGLWGAFLTAFGVGFIIFFHE